MTTSLRRLTSAFSRQRSWGAISMDDAFTYFAYFFYLPIFSLKEDAKLKVFIELQLDKSEYVTGLGKQSEDGFGSEIVALTPYVQNVPIYGGNSTFVLLDTLYTYSIYKANIL